MLLQGVIAAGEAAFVGRLGSHALAGVSLSFPLVMLLTTLAAGAYGGGVASGVARALGAGRGQDAARLAGTALGMSAIFGLASTAAMVLFGRAFYTVSGPRDRPLKPQSATPLLYSSGPFRSGCIAPPPVSCAGRQHGVPGRRGHCSWRGHARGLSGRYLWRGTYPRAWDRRAAWAVVAYNLAMAAVLLRAVWAAGSPARPEWSALVPQWRYAFEVLRVSVPSAASTLLTNMTFIILTALVAPFGTEAIAGYGAGGRLEYLLIPIVFGVGSALVPLVAASDGAGDFARVCRLTRAGAAPGAGGCGLVGGAAALFPWAWMGLFTSEPAVAGHGTAYLVRVGPAYAFLGLGLALYFAAQGRGRTAQPLFETLTRLLVAGALGALGRYAFGWRIESLFVLMACGLVLYGLVMVVVMHRELGCFAGGR